MSTYCTVTLVGYLGRAPEMDPSVREDAAAPLPRDSRRDPAQVHCSMSTRVYHRDKRGKRHPHTDWHTLTATDEVARRMLEEGGKGDQVAVVGRLHYGRWRDRFGQPRVRVTVRVQQFRVLRRAGESLNPTFAAKP